MGDLEARLLARAQELEQDMPEVAETVTGILSGARAARVDPDALNGLVGAAFALGADQIAVYQAGTNGEPAYGDESEFMAAVAEAEDDAEDLRRAAMRLRAEVVAARGLARLAYASAFLMPVLTAEQRRQRREALDKAQLRIDTCNEALDILADMISRLDYALRRLGAVPSDLGDTYESVYDLIRHGGVMPYDGDFIAGPAQEGAA
jgi:hypothetical protein